MAVVPGRARPLFPSRRTTRREPQGGGALEGQHALQPCPNTITARSAGKRKEKRKEKKDLSLYVVERRETIAVCTLVIECRQELCACATASAAHAPPHRPLPLRPLQLTRSKGALNHIYSSCDCELCRLARSASKNGTASWLEIRLPRQDMVLKTNRQVRNCA